ncbi:MAG: aspartate kinase [Gammaproteobacteria bacterium]|nr:aspartate kinase [Gammaproteobacteria bacterium]
MALIVQKYGGTSVADGARIGHVADKVCAARRAGHDLLVVVSAMAGETDRLLSLGKNISQRPNPRELDVLLATGEQVSIALLAIALEKRGLSACSFTGGQVCIRTDDAHTKARILAIDEDKLRDTLARGCIPVVAGFQGVDAAGNITTLGRGGSDTTAVALAAALKADECQIYTDVDGVYTTDPRMVPEARRLARITFEEMLELASLGSKVLQIRAVEFAGKYNVPLRVLSTFKEGAGTLITYEDTAVEAAIVSGIAFNRDEAEITLIGVPDVPGTAYRILGPVAAANIVVDMIVQNVARGGRLDFSFTIHRNDYPQTIDIMQANLRHIGAEQVVGNDRVVKISIVGVGMRSHAGVASSVFQALSEEDISIRMVATSEIKISVVVEEKHLELGVRTLHAAFRLHEPPQQDFLQRSAGASRRRGGITG